MIDLSNISILSATFNRHDFTLSMIGSFAMTFKTLQNMIIIDNSDSVSLPNNVSKIVRVIDNTNFKNTPNYHQPSKNHCASIDWVLRTQIKTKYCMLCDNDILFKPAVISLLQDYDQYDAIGEIGWDKVPPARLYPYWCIINVEFMRKHRIKYYDETRCMVDNATMDTGCSFLHDMQAASAKIKTIKLSEYIIHLKGGTLRNKPLGALHERAGLIR